MQAREIVHSDPATLVHPSTPAGYIGDHTKGTSTHCSICGVRGVCFACDMLPRRAEACPGARIRKVARGEYLYRAGDEFTTLFTVRSGSLKTALALPDGSEQVTGFPLSGDLLGAEAIGAGTHRCHAIALEDSRICAFGYAEIEDAGGVRSLPHQRLRMAMSMEIAREHGLIVMLGMMDADERVADFLLNLSRRFALRDLPAAQFQLRMKREEIGSYLGMKVETVSRTFSRFRDAGLILVDYRRIHILDFAGLRDRIVHGFGR